MPVSRKDVDKYLHDLERFYTCLTKVSYKSKLVATKSAYALEVIRRDRVYDVYPCPFCAFFHVGRKKKNMIDRIIKRSDWIWNR